jgi:hypothetical protein
LARRTHPFLTERGRELGADPDDRVSSRAGVGDATDHALVSVVKRGASCPAWLS